MAVALPIPSLDDRPFGVHLWPHFSKVFELVAGYPADEFNMPNAGHCAGEEFAAFAGIIVITSYLVLFILFYFATYNKDGSPQRPQNAPTHVPGRGSGVSQQS
ncbi:hypothetical protein ETB97_000032 [Aspergillus alliaceus]|uniref:Uncharacterized protein n=1 Tax=Petromyces alliaceus TaxID=209559 RepID=A0A8H6AD37_PETAA|nr:hypothetical protein ETB97_000032 [Aspergillus burnettii]